MKLVEALPVLSTQIQCTACGECCPDCEKKDGNLCSVHPKRSGQQDVIDARQEICQRSPVDLTVGLGMACKPVVASFENLTGKKLTTSFCGFCVGDHLDRIQLNRLLQEEIDEQKLYNRLL